MSATAAEAHDKAVSGATLRLSISELPVWLGDLPDFSGLKVSDAGEIRRPDVAESPEAMCDLTTGLIRVRDDEGRVIRTWDPKVEPSELRAGLGHMPLVRDFERRMVSMNGKETSRSGCRSWVRRPSPAHFVRPRRSVI
jgi:hypothetical protein